MVARIKIRWERICVTRATGKFVKSNVMLRWVWFIGEFYQNSMGGDVIQHEIEKVERFHWFLLMLNHVRFC